MSGGMDAGLYIVGTPIGNLQDITLRALDTLRAASIVLAEDTRETRKLLERHGIRAPLVSHHKFNEAAREAEIVARVRNGEAVALVTDSGMPAISDPGARIVDALRREALPVFVVPGPSAATAAVALAGIPGAGFVFGGFLPHKSGARRRRLTELGNGTLPLVLFESPYRLLKLMAEIAEVLGPRRVCVAREMTKKFEETLRGTPAEIAAAFATRAVKGEITVVIAPASETPDDPGDEGGDIDTPPDSVVL